MSIVKSLLWCRNPLSRAAQAGDRKLVLDVLEKTDIFVLTLVDELAIEPESVTVESLSDFIVASGNELDKDVDIAPFSYVEGNERILPMFTSLARSANFVQWYVDRSQQTTAFGSLEVRGGVIRPIANAVDKLLLDPGSRCEVDLSFAMK